MKKQHSLDIACACPETHAQPSMLHSTPELYTIANQTHTHLTYTFNTDVLSMSSRPGYTPILNKNMIDGASSNEVETVSLCNGPIAFDTTIMKDRSIQAKRSQVNLDANLHPQFNLENVANTSQVVNIAYQDLIKRSSHNFDLSRDEKNNFKHTSSSSSNCGETTSDGGTQCNENRILANDHMTISHNGQKIDLDFVDWKDQNNTFINDGTEIQKLNYIENDLSLLPDHDLSKESLCYDKIKSEDEIYSNASDSCDNLQHEQLENDVDLSNVSLKSSMTRQLSLDANVTTKLVLSNKKHQSLDESGAPIFHYDKSPHGPIPVRIQVSPGNSKTDVEDDLCAVKYSDTPSLCKYGI